MRHDYKNYEGGLGTYPVVHISYDVKTRISIQLYELFIWVSYLSVCLTLLSFTFSFIEPQDGTKVMI